MPHVFGVKCDKAFKDLEKALISASVVKAPDWTKPFEHICDANDFFVGVVLGKRRDKVFSTIYYASMTLI